MPDLVAAGGVVELNADESEAGINYGLIGVITVARLLLYPYSSTSSERKASNSYKIENYYIKSAGQLRRWL